VPIIAGQATVPASSTVALFTVPPSYCSVTFYNINTAATSVYIGTSKLVSSANGLVCHSIPVSFNTYMGSSGGTFYATTGGAVASSVNYLIATDF
jgi:hypothetical protein